MGRQYEIKCDGCGYSISVTEGVGMMYAPHAVFYGCCNNPTQNWSIALPDGYCEEGEPLLLSFVKSKKIKEKAFSLLSNGAHPDDEYGHELYACPKCMRLANRFYFKISSPVEEYEPDYKCSKCKTSLQRAEVKIGKDKRVKLINRGSKRIDWKCPDCGGNQLIPSDHYIMWD